MYLVKGDIDSAIKKYYFALEIKKKHLPDND